MQLQRRATRPRKWPSLPRTGIALWMIFELTACVPSAQPPNCFCPVSLHPDEETKKWLANMSPPPSAIGYFHQIGVQQKDIEKACDR